MVNNMISEERKSTLKRINYLLDTHCSDCDINAKNKLDKNAQFATADSYCRKICEVGFELRECGIKLSKFRR